MAFQSTSTSSSGGLPFSIDGFDKEDNDHLQYCIYVMPPTATTSSRSSIWHNKEAETALTISPDVVEGVRELIMDCTASVTRGYIWHFDSFFLQTEACLDHGVQFNASPPHLRGVSRVKGNLEDEWYMVSILLHLTNEFPNLVVSVKDNDGELLLIEAEKKLPQWVRNLQKAVKNRVYLYRGAVLLIPPIAHLTPNVLPYYLNVFNNGSAFAEQKKDGKLTNRLSVAQALQLIASTPPAFYVNSEVTTCILNKIFGYPGKGVTSYTQHTTRCYLSPAIVKCLEECPQLISLAVRAFCDDLQESTKWIHQMNRFPPRKGILCSVKFTKMLYAEFRFKSEKFHPPACFAGFVNAGASRDTLMSRRGIKIACGFEIAYQRSRAAEPANTRAYRAQEDQTLPVTMGGMRLSFSKVVDEILSRFDEEELMDLIPSKVEEEDSEDWMTLTPAETDSMLAERLQNPAVQRETMQSLNAWGEEESPWDGIDGDYEEIDSPDEATMEYGRMEDDDDSSTTGQTDDEDSENEAAAWGASHHANARDKRRNLIDDTEEEEVPTEVWQQILPTMQKMCAELEKEGVPSLSKDKTDTNLGEQLVVNFMESVCAPGGGAQGPAANLLNSINLSAPSGRGRKRK
eukprot:TRINITY_DN49335_c0_g1_i1.p1 TRINITY_DN49335_c0_g1~~TRINITY_DN49335_c0_g1_i1.p1  ORF type:complete len:629 (-),score=63.75 TRINITY_DN49335_c0_g1_i1:1107-2993(-)